VLLFLAKQAVEFPSQTVKEHQIATSALGRSINFDPRIDSMVRVVVTRLRANWLNTIPMRPPEIPFWSICRRGRTCFRSRRDRNSPLLIHLLRRQKRPASRRTSSEETIRLVLRTHGIDSF
jgi:hypothetical protein